MAAIMILTLLLTLRCFLASAASSTLVRLGPSFTTEPPAVVRYAASAGARVPCAARGNPPPRVAWLTEDGSPLTDMPGIRRIYGNGTLEVFPSSAYREAAPTTVRCRAANPHGALISRDVLLHPVADTKWEVQLSGASVSSGGVAALACRTAPDAHAAPLATPALFYRGERVLHVDAPSPDARYLLAGSALLIRDVSPADSDAYSCLARHSLTALTKRSRPAHLTVLSSSSNSAPRLVATESEVSIPAGTSVCMPCVASEYPPPHYTWYRERNGRLQPVEPSPSVWLWAGGAALCFTRASRVLSGAWLCKAYNVFGDATAQMRVDVQDSFTVTVDPTVVIAEAGSTVRLNCTSSDPGATLRWAHDGAALTGVGAGAGAGAGGVLVLRGVSRAHAGMYQCLARRGARTEQAAAEIRLGDSPPELQYTFIEQALRAGGSVALRCIAAASPPPRISWLLDGHPLDHYLAHHRYSISEEASIQGEVVSILNVTSAAAADGGRYTCRAANPLGGVEHSARLNIYGPPSIRSMNTVRAVAGENLTLHCPYAGYPISSVSWWRRGAAAALGGAGRVSARAGVLRLAPALPHDAGHYACSVTPPAGAPATRDVEIQVRNPPKISPFMFSTELTEGSSVQVLCGVSSGDKPMYFSWFKDGSPLPPNLQIEEKSLNEFSLLMFSELSARHSGAYTCRVSNHAATVNYTAPLSVKVAPSWITEPLDTAVLLGATLLLECAAKGYPTPTVTWFRKIGEGISGMENSDRWEVAGSDWSGESSQLMPNNQMAISANDANSGQAAAGSSSLSARAATRSHQGLYRCTADNGVGPPLVKHVNVTVHEPAHFGLSSESVRNTTSVRGRSVVLTCLALGDPPLTVHWTHRGNKLDLDSYRWTISEVRTSEGVRSSLQLRAAERHDAGEYRCHARNQYGRSDLLMFLQVEEPPDAPRSLQLGGAGSRWVRVRWAAPASPRTHYAALCTPLHALPAPDHTTHHYNLTLDAQNNDRSDEDGLTLLSAKLEGLRPSAAYSLRLVATNHVGQSPHSDALLFTTLEEAPSGSPQNVRVRPINTGDLHVSWSAPAQDSWNGELLGYAISWREVSRAAEVSEGAESSQEEAARAGTVVARGWSSAELTLGGLNQFARYAVTARAFNRAGPGPPSSTAYATTADGVPEEPPNSVTCEALSARSLRVRWLPPAQSHSQMIRGYDLHYAPLHFSQMWSGAVGSEAARAAAVGEAVLQGLRAATNYSVSVRARSDRGAGPPSPPTHCRTREDVPGAPETIRALAAGPDAVRVSWIPPAERGGRLTHYTLYTRELGKVGGEWSQRVEAIEDGVEGESEVWHEVRGLRERAVYEFWVRAATAAGSGPPSRAVNAAPTQLMSARISSLGRIITAPIGTRVRLRCTALGIPPISRRWMPLPHGHTITDTGDLIIHKMEQQTATNYSCSVRNAAGGDSAVFALRAVRAPAAPAPRLARADAHALHLAWDPPHDGGAVILGYTVWWWRGWEPETAAGGVGSEGGARWWRVGGEARGAALRGLACGAPYRVSVRAHNAVGASPHSRALVLRTRGDKAKAPAGKECIWANSTCLRLALLAWGGRCAVARFSVALRLASGGAWSDVPTDGETVEVTDLEPGTWYEIRVLAHYPAGETPALYKAATHTINGERLGEPIELPLEARMSAADGAVGGVTGGGSGAGGAWWRGGAGAALALLSAALAALLVAAATLACRRRARPRPALPLEPHTQPLYVAQPTQTNGKTITPPDDLHEISPYATFSMSSGATSRECGAGGGAEGGEGGVRSCALHLRSFVRDPLELAAPPPRPHLLAHPNDYGSARDSDSESSGSPCAACAAELYRLPAARLSDTLPAGSTGAAESSTEDGSYGAAPRPRARRRDHARQHQPTVRYFSSAALRRSAI